MNKQLGKQPRDEKQRCNCSSTMYCEYFIAVTSLAHRLDVQNRASANVLTTGANAPVVSKNTPVGIGFCPTSTKGL